MKWRAIGLGSAMGIMFVLPMACASEVQPHAAQDVMTQNNADALDANNAAAFFAAQVKPLTDAKCAACHAGGHASAPAFLKAEPDAYTSIRSAIGIVDRLDARSSRILTKGQHEGPAWSQQEATTVQQWLELEAAEGMGAPDDRPHTQPLKPMEGENSFDLTDLGLPGARIIFVWTSTVSSAGLQSSTFFSLSALTFVAGPSGLIAKHPQLVVWQKGVPSPDAIDRLGNANIQLAPLQSKTIEGSDILFFEYPEGGISFYFSEIATP